MTSLSKPKTTLAEEHLTASRRAALGVTGHPVTWAEVTESTEPTRDLALVAVDTAQARRQVQAFLPRSLINAWTQTGDLGASTHDFLDGACCACLYLPTGKSQNEDEIVAAAFGVPDRLMEVRTLLYNGQPVPDELLDTLVERLNLEARAVDSFRGHPIRHLYVAGICGEVCSRCPTTRPDTKSTCHSLTSLPWRACCLPRAPSKPLPEVQLLEPR